jgi:hypothetical protein
LIGVTVWIIGYYGRIGIIEGIPVFMLSLLSGDQFKVRSPQSAISSPSMLKIGCQKPAVRGASQYAKICHLNHFPTVLMHQGNWPFGKLSFRLKRAWNKICLLVTA